MTRKKTVTVQLDHRKLELISRALHDYVKDAQRTTDADEREVWEAAAPEDRSDRPKTWRDLEQEGEWPASEIFWLDGEIYEAILELETGKQLKIRWQ